MVVIARFFCLVGLVFFVIINNRAVFVISGTNPVKSCSENILKAFFTGRLTDLFLAWICLLFRLKSALCGQHSWKHADCLLTPTLSTQEQIQSQIKRQEITCIAWKRTLNFHVQIFTVNSYFPFFFFLLSHNNRTLTLIESKFLVSFKLPQKLRSRKLWSVIAMINKNGLLLCHFENHLRSELWLNCCCITEIKEQKHFEVELPDLVRPESLCTATVIKFCV